MPNWKKLIVSGSDASLNSLNVTNNVTAQSFTGSFSGSFTAPGATTQVVYNSGGVLAANSGFVYSGSNVGIGTTSPQGKLEVFSSSDNQLRLDASGTYSAMYLTQNQTPKAAVWMNHGSLGMFVGTTVSNGYLALGTDNSSEKMRITSAGNVGIGTTSPSSKLHVTDTSNPTINIGTLNGNTGNASIQFYSGTGGSNNGFLLQYIKNGSTDRFGFIDGGSVERLTVLNGGNVGIGTTSPGAKLHVASGEIRVDAGQAVTLDTSNSMYLVGASNQLRLYNGGNPIVNITTGGNVGINTTSPSQVLEVQGQAQIGNDSVTSAGLFIARKNTNQAKSHYFLSAQESPTYQWIEGGYFTSELAGVSVANNSGKPYYEAYSPAGQNKSFGFINQTTSGSSFTSTAATASMVLYQGGNIALAPTQGNVGIGTTAPAASLHTIGSTNFTQIVQSTTSVAYTQYYNSSTGTGGTNDGLTIGLNGTSGLVYLRENADLFFGTADTERMRITSAGNIGIGTSSPSTKLDVIGNSYISGSLSVKTTSTAGTGLTVGGSTVLLSFAEMQQGNVFYFYSSGNTYGSSITQNGQHFIISPDTNVGIGTTSPTAKLEVNGNVKATSFTGSFSGSVAAPGATTQVVYNSGGVLAANSGFVYSGSNVGIGTSSPSFKLEVAGSTKVQYLQIQDNGYGGGLPTTPEIYSPASATLAISAGGSERLRIDSSGNVGIGTTSPTSKLDVRGTLTVSGSGANVDIKSSTTTSTLNIYGSDTSTNFLGVGILSDNVTRWRAGMVSGRKYQIAYADGGGSFTPTAAMTIVSGSGDVGIGTTSPSYRLDVVGSVRLTNAAAQLILDNATYSELNYGTSNYFRANGSQAIINGPSIAFLTGGTEKVRIDSSGNVGIGTSSPLSKLHVEGVSDLLTLKMTSGGYNALTLSTTFSGGNNYAVNPYITGISNGGFEIKDITNNVSRIAIAPSTGNVGIGTTSPSQKLDVAGAISVSGSVVDYEVAPALIGGVTTTNIISFTPGTHYAAFVDYVIKDASTGANQRVGTIQISISLAGAAAVMNEVTTIDIGNTSAITFAVSYGAPTWLTATNSGPTPYDINYMVRYF